jgi:hypothetical protein
MQWLRVCHGLSQLLIHLTSPSGHTTRTCRQDEFLSQSCHLLADGFWIKLPNLPDPQLLTWILAPGMWTNWEQGNTCKVLGMGLYVVRIPWERWLFLFYKEHNWALKRERIQKLRSVWLLRTFQPVVIHYYYLYFDIIYIILLYVI